jgi:glycosyltransferase involved in cell wall biosynthesis
MNSSTTISVICPTYNRQDLLSRAVQSVLNQTYKNFELIVVDDGSTDGTEKAVGSFKDERIRYIRLEKNMGAGAARNRGIEVSRGKYIAFQDSDDEWLPEKLEKQIEVFKKTAPSKIGVVYTDMWRMHSDGRAEYWHSPTIRPGRIIGAEGAEYQVFKLGILSVLVRRQCFDEVGFFDERFPALEDLELFIRLSMQYGFYHIKEPLVKYYQVEGISSNYKNQVAARALLLEKHNNEIKTNKRFISNQYFLISSNFYSCGDVVEGRKYLLKAILACPLYKEPLFLFKIIIGDNAYVKLRKFCRKVKSTWRQLLY